MYGIFTKHARPKAVIVTASAANESTHQRTKVPSPEGDVEHVEQQREGNNQAKGHVHVGARLDEPPHNNLARVEELRENQEHAHRKRSHEEEHQGELPTHVRLGGGSPSFPLLWRLEFVMSHDVDIPTLGGMPHWFVDIGRGLTREIFDGCLYGRLTGEGPETIDPFH